MRRYRIVRDSYLGFEVQTWCLWWPFWVQGNTNTHPSIEAAERYARHRSEKDQEPYVVKYLGKVGVKP